MTGMLAHYYTSPRGSGLGATALDEPVDLERTNEALLRVWHFQAAARGDARTAQLIAEEIRRRQGVEL